VGLLSPHYLRHTLASTRPVLVCGDMVLNLHAAAASGDVAAVRRLVTAGADVEEYGEGGERPVHARGGDIYECWSS
jgi:hypothetical protein